MSEEKVKYVMNNIAWLEELQEDPRISKGLKRIVMKDLMKFRELVKGEIEYYLQPLVSDI